MINKKMVAFLLFLLIFILPTAKAEIDQYPADGEQFETYPPPEILTCSPSAPCPNPEAVIAFVILCLVVLVIVWRITREEEVDPKPVKKWRPLDR